MTALAADIQRVLQSGRDIAPISRQVLASTTIYDGSAVMCLAASHYARPCAAAATGQFLGFAQERKTAGATQAAAPTVLIHQQGKLQIPNTAAYWGTPLVLSDHGKRVGMSDDGTGFLLDLNADQSTGCVIGKVDNIDLVNGLITIAFQSYAMRSV